MLVSCVCPTYNRCPNQQWLLEEAVESFLKQDYPDKELIIVNDAPEQTLYANSPNVTVVNYTTRFASLGEKRNAGVAHANGELICPWDDDDISLSWRISQSVMMLEDMDYWKPPQVWFIQVNQPPVWKHGVGVRHHASIFRRSAWRKIGGYPLISIGEDARIDQALKGHTLPIFPHGLSYDQWAYIYRWGVSPCHVSGRNTHPQENYDIIGKRPINYGEYMLEPRWLRDYEELINQVVLSGAA